MYNKDIHIKEHTSRGFAIYDEFVDSYNNVVRIQESSSAEGSYCWIFVDDHKSDNPPGAHLSIEQAKKLVEALQSFILHREEGDK